jgi:hypothetical protein
MKDNLKERSADGMEEVVFPKENTCPPEALSCHIEYSP